MVDDEKKEKTLGINKLLIVLGLICVILAMLIIGMNLNFEEISLLAKNADYIKESYSSTESNTWDVSELGDGSVIAKLDENGLLTISGTGKMQDCSYAQWYSERKQIKCVVIENGVTSIGAYAFENCDSITGIEIPSSVTSIGEGAFWGCDGLVKIEIPSSVTSIGACAFTSYNLASIKVDKDNVNYKDEEGVLYTKDGRTLIAYPAGKTKKQYRILDETQNIGEGAFFFCDKLLNIEVPSSVRTIGEYAFTACWSLVSIEIPEGVTNIGDYAFNECSCLTSIEIPEGVTSIGEGAFGYCQALTSINIPKSVTSIGERAFEGCYLNDVIYTTNDIIEMPNILKRAKDENDILYSNNEFNIYNCTIENETIKINDEASDSVIRIESGVLEGFEYYITYNTLDISATENDNVKATLSNDGTLTISGTGEMNDYISDTARDFGLRSLVKKVIIEEGVTNIGEGEFYGCYNLESIEIPKGVNNIGSEAFLACTSLKSIEVDENNIMYKDEEGVLYTKDGRTLISYPAGKTKTTYRILNGTQFIGTMAFTGCDYLTNIEIPEGVISIGDYAFYWCESLTNIEIPSSVTNIGEYVFEYNYNVTIICNKDTVAEIYVKENNIKYIIKIDEINPKTTVKQFKEKLENETEYEITNQNGEKISETAYVGTGYKVKKADGTIYTIIVTGDVSGDGQADIKDILAINKHRLNKAMLEVQYLLAADVNEDGQADIKDILQINKFRLGKINSL